MVDSRVRILAGKLLCSSPIYKSGLRNTQVLSSNIQREARAGDSGDAKFNTEGTSVGVLLVDRA